MLYALRTMLQVRANFFMDDVSNFFQKIQLTIEDATPKVPSQKLDQFLFDWIFFLLLAYDRYI